LKKNFTLLPPLIFLGLFYFYPLISIFALSFAPQGQFDLTSLKQFVSSSYYLKIFWFTTWQALLSTVLTVGLALPGAYVFARYDFAGKSLLRALTTIPFVLPTIVVANGFTALLGARGLLNVVLMTIGQTNKPVIHLQHTLTLILLAHVFYNYTIVLRMVSGFWANLDPRLPEAAQLLGATRWQAFRQITWPLLAPSVLAAALLVFIFCFTSFGVILILGGPSFATLEVEIYRQAVNLFNLPMAAVLSLWQIGFMFALMLVYTRLQTGLSRPLNWQSQQVTQRTPQNWRERLFVWGNVGLMATLLGTPLVALLIRSCTVDGQFSLAYYYALFGDNPQRDSLFFVPPREAITNSLIFALSTVACATVLGLLTAIFLTPTRISKIKGLTGLTPTMISKIKGLTGLTPTRISKIKGLTGLTPTRISKIKGLTGLTPTRISKIKGLTGLTPTRISKIKGLTRFNPVNSVNPVNPVNPVNSVNPVNPVNFVNPNPVNPLILLILVIDALFMLPMATSAVTLGFGYIITMNRPPLDLRTSPVLVVIAHTLVALPFVIRSILPALRSIQPMLREAAAILGASPWRVWWEIDLPIARRALLVGAVFAFTISMGEFGATLFIARPNMPTIPLIIFRLLSQPGALNYGQALAMSNLLMLVCALGFILIEHFRIDELAEF